MKNLGSSSFVWTMCAVVWGVFAAKAATVSETTADMTVGGTWTVSVAAGDTNIVTAAQTGSGKIVKQGGGVLVLAAENSFSGGITLEAGYIFAAESHCLGTGEIEIKGQTEDYSGPCEIRFTASGKDFGSPAIHVTGNTTVTCPALLFNAATNVFSGTINAEHDLYLGEDSMWLYDWFTRELGTAYWSVQVQATPIMTFNGAISAKGTLHLLPDGSYDFNAPVTAAVLESYLLAAEKPRKPRWTSENQYYGHLNLKAENHFGMVKMGFREISFGADGALGGAVVTNVTVEGGCVRLESGVNCVVAGIEVPRLQASSIESTLCRIYSVAPDGAKLTVTGMPGGVACTSYMTLGDRLTRFTLDAADNPGFVQTFLGRRHVMGGVLEVKAGTLRLLDGATFPNLTELTLGGTGVLDITENGAFPFTNAKLALKLSSDTSQFLFNAPLAITVAALYVDGEQLLKGVWTHAQCAAIPEGLTITATTGDPPAPSATLYWSGAAAGDNLMSTKENWETGDGNGIAPPTAPDLVNGTLGVRITKGDREMVPPETGAHVNQIEFNVPAEAQSGLDGGYYGPFVLGATGRTLTIVGKFCAKQRAQLVLRGTITSPSGIDQGPAAENDSTTFTYIPAKRDSSVAPANTIWGYSGSMKYGTPLVLDGVTMNKPAYIRASTASAEQFYALPNTTNIFLQEYFGGIGGNNTMSVGAGAIVEFRGGVKIDGRPILRLGGTILVTGKPWYGRNGNTGVDLDTGTFIVDVEDNEFGNTPTVNKGFRLGQEGTAASVSKLEFRRSGCFKDNDMEQLSMVGAKNATIEFHSTTQRLSRFTATNTHGSSRLRGDYPAMLEVKGGTHAQDSRWLAGSALETMSCSVQVEGGLGFHYLGSGPANGSWSVAAGADETFTLSGKSFASCGDLEVSGGTLELASGATWRNGTNLTARGTGTLKANAGGAFGDHAILRLYGNGKFALPSTEMQRVAECWVDGCWVRPGIYEAAKLTPADALYGHLTGGRLRVGSAGFMLIVK
ncbi:MAG: hypothetical protein MJ240_10240 [Kiritimatiellae bacterium]|nr:hypothetical protein [Kiritimatiellia bacterium]